MIEQLFERIKKWKAFPNYKMETKVDIILSLYLEDIIAYKFKKKAKLILPEFPVHIGTIYSNNSNKSYKIDFLVITDDDHVYLTEFKTDDKSIREEQIKYLKVSQKKGFQKLLKGLIKIHKASAYKSKYEVYFDELIQNKILVKEGITFKPVKKTYNTEIIFIVPNINDPLIQNFKRISLKECAEIIKNQNKDSFSLGFSNVIKGF